jgi:PAS domain S-box-containing protein
MESFYTLLSVLAAGASIATGLIVLFAGMQKNGDKTGLLFCLLALCVFLFLIIPPSGYILSSQPPYPLLIIVKRMFVFCYYFLLPRFFEEYSAYRRRFLSRSITVLLVLAFVAMLFTRSDTSKPLLWVLMTLVPLSLIFYYGLAAARWQMQTNSREAGRWLLVAVIFYGILFSLSAFNLLSNNYLGKLFGTKLFYPFLLQQIIFPVIMGTRLLNTIFKKYRLEKILGWSTVRWNSLVQNMQVMLVELDTSGVIKHLNPYAVTALGLGSETEWLNKNWFDHFLPKDQVAAARAQFQETIRKGKMVQYFTSLVLSRSGRELYVNWNSIFIYDDNQNPRGIMSIGVDITEQEKAFKEIQILRNELEKENLQNSRQPLLEDPDQTIIGQSEAILYAIQKAKLVSSTNATVMLQGETGVGKELFANLIHKTSNRNRKAYVKINCAALPPDLIESELFGHEKGAFTGAIQARKGKFEQADGGTIFLDEIGELPLFLQPKLLRVLQSNEFERIGGQKTIKVDVRIISATNRDLANDVKAHRFREDLFYRLNVYPITIPPLRNRKVDIPFLVNYLVNKTAEDHHKEIENISKADMIRLVEYPWPGNVRELVNVIERSVISSEGRTLKLDWLTDNQPQEQELSLSMEEIDRTHILKVLRGCGWKISGPDGAAEKLGLNPNTLRSKIKKLHIVRDEP